MISQDAMTGNGWSRANVAQKVADTAGGALSPLRSCARPPHRPGDFYFAPDGADLEGIYREIAGRVVGCP